MANERDNSSDFHKAFYQSIRSCCCLLSPSVWFCPPNQPRKRIIFTNNSSVRTLLHSESHIQNPIFHSYFCKWTDVWQAKDVKSIKNYLRLRNIIAIREKLFPGREKKIDCSVCSIMIEKKMAGWEMLCSGRKTTLWTRNNVNFAIFHHRKQKKILCWWEKKILPVKFRPRPLRKNKIENWVKAIF